jgi:hypothetical protein
MTDSLPMREVFDETDAPLKVLALTCAGDLGSVTSELRRHFPKGA